MNELLKILINPPTKYRSIPFWSWNDELKPEMLRQQIKQMDEAGIGGFFMHARGGLKTEYLSHDWMTCVDACIEEAKERNMDAWCYDENGWPSGFAGGIVTGLGEDYHVRHIEIEEVDSETDGAVEGVLGSYTYGEVKYSIRQKSNPGYIDILNKDVVKAFIEATHEVYYEKFGDEFGKGIKGFFTDEPQYSRELMPWSNILPEHFKERYSYDLVPNLLALFLECEGYQKVRYDYWSLVTDLYITAYAKQIYEWCEEHNCQMTGHTIQEDNLLWQMYCSGGVMPFYEYMQMPGMDWLGRGISSPLVPKQVSSVANQLGKPFVLTETFAGCGWDISLEELKWIGEWQFVNGVNIMAQHLESYSLRGKRKRDYPPSLFIQQPWWEQYKNFNDYFARLAVLLTSGIQVADVLLLHPMKSAWLAYDLTNNEVMKELDHDLNWAIETLSAIHEDYHLGDETILKRHGKVEGKDFIVGQCKYKVIVIPSMHNMDISTLNLLEVFVANGGLVLSVGDYPTLCKGERNPRLQVLKEQVVVVVGNDVQKLHEILKSEHIQMVSIADEEGEVPTIQYQLRTYENHKILYMVNLSQKESYDSTVKMNGAGHLQRYDALEARLEEQRYQTVDDVTEFNIRFLPMQSHVMILDENQDKDKDSIEKTINDKESMIRRDINLEDEWTIECMDDNALTLDICDYQIDDEAWVNAVPVIELMDRLLKGQKTCQFKMRFTFDISVPVEEMNNLAVVIEHAKEFEIVLNGQTVGITQDDWWLDHSMDRIDIKYLVEKGINELVLSREFHQSPEVYGVLFGEDVLESELNKITYETELESIYIVGDFGVISKSEFRDADEKQLICPFYVGDKVDYVMEQGREQFTSGPFQIIKSPHKIVAGDLTRQGLTFFAGTVTLSQEVHIEVDDSNRYNISFDHMDATVAKVIINDQDAKVICWKPYSVDVTDLLIDGTNKVAIKLYASNRNLLGPHHNGQGVEFMANPTSFGVGENWTDDYCFVRFGLRKKDWIADL